MLDQGIISHSNSYGVSVHVLAKKKNSELRLCIDFRRLNEMTKKVSYPLPNIDDCLEPLAGNKYLTQLDMASGFWQILVAENCTEFTSFRTERGQFEFNRMPFGLCNAPASFQRLINGIFGKLYGENL